MLTYLEFLKENKQETNDLFRFFKDINDFNTYDHYSNLASEISFPSYRKIKQETIDKKYLILKDLLARRGYDNERLVKLFNKYKHILLNESSDYGDRIDHEFGNTNINFYSGYIDLLFYEISNGEFLLGGYDIGNEEDSELNLITQYKYGWHKTKYGQLIINQQFESVDEFIKESLKNLSKNASVKYEIGKYEQVNEHYLIDKDHKLYYDQFPKDAIYVYDLELEQHILSYKKGYAENLDNFKTILYIAIKEFSEDVNKWISKNRFPDEFKAILPNLLKSGTEIIKYNL